MKSTINNEHITQFSPISKTYSRDIVKSYKQFKLKHVNLDVKYILKITEDKNSNFAWNNYGTLYSNVGGH